MINQVAQNDIFDLWRTTLNTTVDRWNALGEASAITITGGAIDGTVIGGVTPAAITASNLVVASTVDLSSATLILSDNQISGDKISGGTIQADRVELSFDPVAGIDAARKSYVDAQVTSVQDDIIAFTIALG